MFTFHFAWDFLNVGVFTFHFVWYVPHFDLTFCMGFATRGRVHLPFRMGLATFGHVHLPFCMGLVHLPFCMGFATCGRVHLPFCMGLAAFWHVHLPFCMGFATCWHVHLPFCMGFSTCEHVYHIIMPTPRDLIHFGMATFTTSSCHPQAFKRRLVRKNASCGRWSWLSFTPSCSPHHHDNPNQCIYELGVKF